MPYAYPKRPLSQWQHEVHSAVSRARVVTAVASPTLLSLLRLLLSLVSKCKSQHFE